MTIAANLLLVTGQAPRKIQAMSVGVKWYLLASRVHWRPRERAIAACLASLSLSEGPSRVVDVGCGPGLLFSVARHYGFLYLGLDTDKAMLTYCGKRSNSPVVEYRQASASELNGILSPQDIVVLNGVVHHLNDHGFDAAIHAARICRAMIISDHLRVENEIPWLTDWLQQHDRGKFIRTYDRFDQIEDFRVVSSSRFTIRFAGLVCWTYFCNLYSPLARD
jgi:SAM-dependent methyltransferase